MRFDSINLIKIILSAPSFNLFLGLVFFIYIIKVNGEDLAEITGGEVATTNLNSKGREFWFQIRFVQSEIKKGINPLTVQDASSLLSVWLLLLMHLIANSQSYL